MSNRNQLMRTCTACGQEKPLAAFLEITGKHGTRYGLICATCRGAGITGVKNTTLEDDKTTRAASGSRIGAKERAFIENQKQKQIIDAKDQRTEELAKRDFLKEEKDEKRATIAKSERDHRNTFIAAQKQPGFLGKKLPAGTVVRTANPKEEGKNTSTLKNEQEKTAVETKNNEKETISQETKKKNFNLSDQFVDAQAGETKAHSASFLAFQDSLAEVTPFRLLKERLKKLAAGKQEKGKEAGKDPLVDFVEKTWSGPGRRK